jgi:hypothetical protein
MLKNILQIMNQYAKRLKKKPRLRLEILVTPCELTGEEVESVKGDTEKVRGEINIQETCRHVECVHPQTKNPALSPWIEGRRTVERYISSRENTKRTDKRRCQGWIEQCHLIKMPSTKKTSTRSTDHKERHKLLREDHHRRSGEGLVTKTTDMTKTAGSTYNYAAIGGGALPLSPEFKGVNPPESKILREAEHQRPRLVTTLQQLRRNNCYWLPTTQHRAQPTTPMSQGDSFLKRMMQAHHRRPNRNFRFSTETSRVGTWEWTWLPPRAKGFPRLTAPPLATHQHRKRQSWAKEEQGAALGRAAFFRYDIEGPTSGLRTMSMPTTASLPCSQSACPATPIDATCRQVALSSSGE